MERTIQILKAFAEIKGIIEAFEKGLQVAAKKRVLTAEEEKWLSEMNSLMIALRDEYIRESHLKVLELCEIFELSNQRIYQIRGKQKKAA